MSDLESSNAESDNDAPSVTVEMFQCRKCPGKLFTAAEKDVHRKKHKQDKADKNKDKPGPKSRRSTRASSPSASVVTLFAPVSPPDPQETNAGGSQRPGPASRTKRGRTDDAAGKSPSTPKGNKKKKIRSRKHMDNSVVYNTTTGG